MCLAVPGQLLRWINTDPVQGVAEVAFGEIQQPCYMACVPDALPGDFVLVHAGVAIAKLDTEQAERLLHALASIPESENGATP